MAGKVTSLEGKIPKAPPPLQVVSLDGAASMFFGPRAERYNPDALAARKGGLGIYKRMLQDPQVKAVVKFRRDSIIGRGFEFVFGETKLSDDEQKKRTRVMCETVERMTGSFADAVVGVMTGMAYGFSVSEIVTQIIKVDGSPYVGLAELLTRDCESFKFYTDDYGNLTRLTQSVNGREIELDPMKFVHYVQNPDVDQFYGESELRAAYRPWFMKDMDIKLWAAYKERMAGGFLSIELGSSGISPNSPDYTALENVLKNMRSTMGVILPNGVTAEMHTPGATDVYEKALTVHDLEIAKALLVPNLLGMSQAGQTGSYSQSQTQLETYFMTLATDTQRLEQCLNDQLFRVLALQNWDDGEFPRFRFKKASADHVKWVIDSVVALSGAGGLILTPKDESHLRQLLDLAPRDESQDALAKVKQDLVPIQEDPNKTAALALKAKAPAGGAAFTQVHPVDALKKLLADSGREMSPEVEAKLREITDAEVEAKDFSADKSKVDKSKDDEETDPNRKDKKKFSADLALQRVDFAVIAQRALGIEEEIADRVANIAAKTVAQQLTDERLTALLGPDVDSIGQTRIDDAGIGKIKAGFKDGLTRAWALGLNQAMTETAKARKATFSKSDRQAHFAALRENAADWFESNAFRMAGNFTDGMKAIIRQELLQAVKTGLRPEQAASVIFTRLIERGFMTYDAVKANETREQVLELVTEALRNAAGTPNVAAYLNTLVRTNTFEALNEARYAEFSDPAVSDFVVALQYSAILDDRTTPICRELDGHIHAVGSKVWQNYRPPNHYNAVAAGTLIQTDSGLAPIESLMPGDMVMTHMGRFRPVYAVMGKQPDTKQVLRLNLSSGGILDITDEHPVLTTAGWKRADNLQVGDVLYQYAEELLWSTQVLLPKPDDFPSPFDEPLVPYQVARFSRGRVVDFTVQLDADHTAWEREVEDVGADSVLECELVSGQQGQQQGFMGGRLVSPRRGLAAGSASLDADHLCGVASNHERGTVGARFAVAPMVDSGALGHDFRKPVRDLGLLGFAADRNAVALAPSAQGGFANTERSLNGSQRFSTEDMPLGNERGASVSVGKVDHHSSPWEPSTIISIVDIRAPETVWNLGVEDDETFIAGGVIVHNCRSVVFAVTTLDGWDGQESPEPTVEPQEGFK